MKQLFFFASILCSLGALAQSNDFIGAGRIEYERRFLSPASTPGKPVMNVTYFHLDFAATKTLYQPSAGNTYPPQAIAADNIVYADYAGKKRISIKSIFEKKFAVNDTMPPVLWKLTDEKKIIAGIECKRANGVIMDSVYVVAFYTEMIDIPGGPESFSGLPGLILGVSLPHEHISWFATKIQLQSMPPAMPSAVAGGKLFSKQEFSRLLQLDFAGWGQQKQSMLTRSLL